MIDQVKQSQQTGTRSSQHDQDALKLTYMHLGFQNCFRSNTLDPH